MKRQYLSIFSSILAVFLLPSLVLAATIPWAIDTDGNLTISDSGKHYIVTQSNNAPVSNWIKVNDGVKTTITLNGVHLSNTGISSVDLGSHKDTKTTIILEGENSLVQSTEEEAVFHVAGGRLEIGGAGTLKISQEATGALGAGLGSNFNETMAADIVIGGEAKIAASLKSASAIGSGSNGPMTGSVTVRDAAQLDLKLGNIVTGIGSANQEEMSGDIVITGKSRVKIQTGYGATAIGSGMNGEMSGKISILEEAQVQAEVKESGVGLGSGTLGVFSGRILLGDQAQVALSGEDQAMGIGSGAAGSASGTIIITDDVKVAIATRGGSGIGSQGAGGFQGKIQLLENAHIQTQAMDEDGQVIGPGVIGGGNAFTSEDPQGHYKISTEATINGIKAENAQVLVENKLVNIHMVDGKAQNYEVVKPPEPEPPTPPAPQKIVQLPTLVGLRTLRAGRVSVGPVGPGSTGLVEEGSHAFTSLQGEVLYQGKLRFVGESPMQAFVLSFHLGSKYAGKTVQVQQIDQGQVKTQVLRVSEAGLASVPVRTLGDFAVTVQP